MFEIRQRGSTVWREVCGGLTTFMAMSYIIFVQFDVLTKAGMDGGGVIMATCLSAAAASIVMGLLANYPIALAPGMGENYFFAFMLVPAMAAFGVKGVAGWQMGLAMVAISGCVFLLLSFVGFRSYILNSIPGAIKNGIAAGIGLLIATIGLNNGNIVKFSGPVPGFVGFYGNPAGVLTLVGVGVIGILMAYKIRGAVLVGILANTALAIAFGLLPLPKQLVGWPGGIEKTAGGFIAGFGGLWQVVGTRHVFELLIFVFVLLFMDLFDTVGTLVGVAGRAGLMKDGKLPGAEKALAADAVGTIVGAGLGSSTVTSYIESVTGVSVGARTGLAAIVAGVLMCLAMFFQPIIRLVGDGIEVAPDVFKNPMIAPAMIFVGAMMLRAIRDIDWDDVTEYLPAFLAVIVMPLTMSISHGIAIGFVAYAAGKLLTGRVKQCPAIVYVVAGLFVLRYVLWVYWECTKVAGG
jgi:AGZA family xanthine/uracil permease-like MFS transporter